jgi:hypothetical protein
MSDARAAPCSNASGHRANRLLAALEADDFARLEPHLEALQLAAGTVLYESGETVRHAYGEFKWSSQHGLCELFGGIGPEPRPVFSSQGSFAACC